jgi:hypothetical protein
MVFWRRNSPDPLTGLAHALGYAEYPSNAIAQPHLHYILQSHTKSYDYDEYVSLIIHVVEHFRPAKPSTVTQARSDTIQELFDDLENHGFLSVFMATDPASKERKADVEDHVMNILGRWTMLLHHFREQRGTRPVVAAYRRNMKQGATNAPFTENLSALVGRSRIVTPDGNLTQSHHLGIQDEVIETAISLVRLLSSLNSTDLNASGDSSISQGPNPHTLCSSSMYASQADIDIERLSIRSEDLNAFTLSADAAVVVRWTFDLSRHMLLTTIDGQHTLEVFAMPCMFTATPHTSDVLGISNDLATEIQYSYAILFNAWHGKSPHGRLGRFFGFRKVCWCWSCSAFRYRRKMVKDHRTWCDDKQRASKNKEGVWQSVSDPKLATLMQSEPMSEWDQGLFPQLWPRIAVLQKHQLTTRPWSIWMLFRDRRDTLQYWTFL